MPVIQFAPQAQPCQVEDFPKDAKRSHAGALHVRPGVTATVTPAELEHLQKSKVPLRVLRATDPAPKGAPKPQEAPQAAPAGGGSDAPSAASAAPSGATGGDSGADTGDRGGKGGKKHKK